MTGILTIGQAAAAVGCNVRTIRYYEQVGLLPDPVRTDGNQRRFGAADVKRLAFVRQARDLGFSLHEIRRMLELSDDPDQPCDAVIELTRARLAEVDRRLEKLSALRQELTGMLRRCRGGPMADCGIVEALAGGRQAP